MKRIIVVLIIMAAFVLSGCEEMFTFNAFDGMGAPDYPASAAEITEILGETTGDNAGTIDSIKNLTSSKSFYESLDELEETEKQEILDTMTNELKNIYTDTENVSVEERADAAILTAEIFLNSNEEAQAAVNTVAEVALTALDDPAALESVEDVVVNLLESAFGEGDDLTAALDALSQAGDAYEAFGLTLPEDFAITLDYQADRRAAAMAISGDEINYGEIGQKAAVSIAIKIFLENYYEYYNDPITQRSQIVDILTNLDAAAPLGGTNQDLVNDLIDDFLANEALMRILGAMNLDSLLGDFGGE